uniref:RanBD1 domain-containing protein n=1 Tax=Heterorhabditis bacteriophora TaxID=37862 RepID=A0A1I7X7C2_HETBA
MAADDLNASGITSTQQMRTLRFNDKMSCLNREFINQLEDWYKQCPHYDFSSSVKSYLQHVKKLDSIYSPSILKNTKMIDSNKSANVTEPGTPGERVIAKAKRRSEHRKSEADLNTSVKISTPSGAPPRFSIGGETEISILDSRAGSRKRAIRGGGPCGDTESVIFRGADTTAVIAPSFPVPTISLPKPVPHFWSKQKTADEDGKKSKTTTAMVTTIFDKTEKTANDDNKRSLVESTISIGSKIAEDGRESSELICPALDSCKSTKEITEKKTTPMFPSFGSGAGPALSFGKGVSNLQNFSFGVLPTSSTEEKKSGDDEDAEYVPPKPEIIENEEPGAIFTSKCSVFKMVNKQYTKLGVGMFYLKDNDGKRSVLVRAATAIGSVWINALVACSMKVAKADDKGIRISCPTSSSEISTYLIRFPSGKEAQEALDKIETAAK